TVTGPQEARQVGERAVFHGAGSATQHQETRGIARLGGRLGDQLPRQIVIELVNVHGPVVYLLKVGGPEMAPHTPQRSSRPGQAAARLDYPAQVMGPRNGPPHPPAL